VLWICEVLEEGEQVGEEEEEESDVVRELLSKHSACLGLLFFFQQLNC
jgi:hypothetical protein